MDDPDKKKGFYKHYEVKRLNDPAGKHDDCEYLVLDFKHDKFSIPAATMYADMCEAEYPLLAKNLRETIDRHRGLPVPK